MKTKDLAEVHPLTRSARRITAGLSAALPGNPRLIPGSLTNGRRSAILFPRKKDPFLTICGRERGFCTYLAEMMFLFSRTGRRFFVLRMFTATAAALLLSRTAQAQEARPLMAYVGTYSSPLKNMLKTQVDLPPGNGKGIHLFTVDRETGAMAPAGVVEMGTSPSCLAFNAGRTVLYSANETERLGAEEAGSVSAFSVSGKDGKLTLINTVSSGGKGPAHLSVHPSGKFVLVANYFGGSVAVLPVLEGGKLGEAADVKRDAGTVGPTKATNAPPGSFAFSGHDMVHAHMIEADPSGRWVLHVDLGLDGFWCGGWMRRRES
jgi:6-phosphogluconolactonase